MYSFFVFLQCQWPSVNGDESFHRWCTSKDKIRFFFRIVVHLYDLWMIQTFPINFIHKTFYKMCHIIRNVVHRTYEHKHTCPTMNSMPSAPPFVSPKPIIAIYMDLFNFNKSIKGVPTHRNEKKFCYKEMEIERDRERENGRKKERLYRILQRAHNIHCFSMLVTLTS